MPNADQRSKEIDSKTQEVKTIRELTELVVWDGVVRATYTDFKMLDDGSRFPIGTVFTSRSGDTDQSAQDFLTQAYAMADGWLAADAVKVKDAADGAASLDAGLSVP